MWPLSKSQAVATVEPPPAETPEQRYQQSQGNLGTARRERDEANKTLSRYNDTHPPDLRIARFNGREAICVGAIGMYPQRRALESACREKQRRFDLAQEEFAAAKKGADLATY